MFCAKAGRRGVLNKIYKQKHLPGGVLEKLNRKQQLSPKQLSPEKTKKSKYQKKHQEIKGTLQETKQRDINRNETTCQLYNDLTKSGRSMWHSFSRQVMMMMKRCGAGENTLRSCRLREQTNKQNLNGCPDVQKLTSGGHRTCGARTGMGGGAPPAAPKQEWMVAAERAPPEKKRVVPVEHKRLAGRASPARRYREGWRLQTVHRRYSKLQQTTRKCTRNKTILKQLKWHYSNITIWLQVIGIAVLKSAGNDDDE